MKLRWMRRVDKYIGGPLLMGAGFLVRRSPFLGGSEPASRPRRVLCFKFLGLGSIVLSLPLLRVLKEGGAHIAYVTFSAHSELLNQIELVDEVFTVNPTWWGFFPSLVKLILQLRKFKADAALDLEPTANFSALLTLVSRSQIRAGFMSGKPLREKVMTHLTAFSPEKNVAVHCVTLARSIGFIAEEIPELPRLPHLQKRVPKLSSPIFILNPNSGDLCWQRMWPEESWVHLAQKLLERFPESQLVFPGTPAEIPRIQRIVEKLKDPRALSTAGTTTLTALLKLLQEATLVVSADSGIMHLAALAGTPVVALFGPETPSLYGPWTTAKSVLRAQVPCSPCLSIASEKLTYCTDNQCMKRITSTQVFDACLKSLGDSK